MGRPMALLPPATPQCLLLVFHAGALGLASTTILTAASGSGEAEAAQATSNTVRLHC